MQEHEAQSSSTAEITTSSAGQPNALIELIRNDGFAMSFQSVRQYRQALIRVVENTAPQRSELKPAPDVAGLVEALQKEATSLCDAVEKINDLPPVMYALQAGIAVNKVRDAVAALAAHRGQGGDA